MIAIVAFVVFEGLLLLGRRCAGRRWRWVGVVHWLMGCCGGDDATRDSACRERVGVGCWMRICLSGGVDGVLSLCFGRLLLRLSSFVIAVAESFGCGDVLSIFEATLDAGLEEPIQVVSRVCVWSVKR